MGEDESEHLVHCPICRRPAGALRGPHTPEFPFCSQRCREQDLANWAGGKYVIATPAPFTEAAETPPGTADDERE
ncbi:MAG: DNA gyrase inhibitor YacG [Terriglobales bacterium]